jgi:alkylation response protein AidB-like acyl-CoA dehydrogenase
VTDLAERTGLAGGIAEIVAAEMPVSRLREVAAEGSFDNEFWSTLTEAGLFSMLVPEDDGGLGLQLEDAIPIFYELGRNPVPGPVVDNAVAAPIVVAATRAADALTDATVVAVADVEALTRPRSALVVGAERLSGRVELVRSPAVAHAFLAVVSDEGGARILLVPADAPGVALDPDHPLEFGSRYGGVSFDVALADATELTSGPEGRSAATRMRTGLRLAGAAEVAGASRALVELTADYARVREQFGTSIGSFQAVQVLLAEMFEDSSALDSLLDWCIQELAGADAERSHLLGLKAKAGAAGLGRRIAENALQVHGGIGFTAEHDLNVYYKLILAREAHYGDRRSLAAAIGRTLLER